MIALSDDARPISDAAPWRAAFLALALGLTVVRLVSLMLTPLDLHGDEAQYWFWSQDLAWGYFSKPPLIAWTIAGTTGLFGDSEWAVRAWSPVSHALGAAALWALAQRLYGPRAGFWAGTLWLLMPGVWLSAAIASTDALLLPLWSLALLSLFGMIETRSFRWAAALGVACGLGFLAKYAMSYFVVGAVLAAVVAPRARRALVSPQGALAGGIAAAMLAPNLAWNAANDFATVAHTAENANLSGGPRFSFAELGQFFADQLAVFGPLPWIALAIAVVGAARVRRLGEAERILLAFVLPPLLVIMGQAFLSRAHANWAASAYPAATVLLVGLSLARPFAWPGVRRGLLIGGAALLVGLAAAAADIDAVAILCIPVLAFGLWRLARSAGAKLPAIAAATHGVVGAVFVAAALAPGFADRVGLADAFKRSRAWEETAAIVAERVAAGSAAGAYTAVMVDDRLLFNDLAFYWRDGAPAPLRMWRLRARPGNHAETVAPMTAPLGGNVLVVGAAPPYEPLIAQDFQRAGPLERVEIDLGGGEVRRLTFREVQGFAPAPR